MFLKIIFLFLLVLSVNARILKEKEKLMLNSEIVEQMIMDDEKLKRLEDLIVIILIPE
jgi:hypothetical protein